MCLPKDLPEFLEIDLSAMEINDIKRLSDIPLPAGRASWCDLAHGRDEPVVSIHHPRAEEVEAPAAEAAAAAAVPRLLPVLLLRLLLRAPAAGGDAKKEEGKPAAGCGAPKAAAAPKKEGGKK